MGLHSSDSSRIIPGNFTPSTMPTPQEGYYAWDTTYGCYMLACGGVWKKPNYDVTTDYSGSTDVNGNYTVTYTTMKSTVPFVCAVLSPQTDASISYRLSSSTVNGFTIKAEQRASLNVLGVNLLSFAVTNAAAQPVRVFVKD